MSQPVGPTQPSIGRIVHVARDTVGAVPAIVTEVLDDAGTVGVTAFPPGSAGVPLNRCEHVEPVPGVTPAAGTWHWPPIR